MQVGVLPEQTILYDWLSPIDHLELYRRIKGITPHPEERYE